MPSVMSARRPAALTRGPSAKPKSKVVAARGSRPATLKSARHAGGQRAGADAAQALRHQAAVVGVELHDVGHGTQRDQGQQRIEPGLRRRLTAVRGASEGAPNTPRARNSERSASST